MKTYYNGPRKGYMYGGMIRKPMMYGGDVKKATKKMAMGGKTFPDLSGDGKVTQKDILMGKKVI